MTKVCGQKSWWCLTLTLHIPTLPALHLIEHLFSLLLAWQGGLSFCNFNPSCTISVGLGLASWSYCSSQTLFLFVCLVGLVCYYAMLNEVSLLNNVMSSKNSSNSNTTTGFGWKTTVIAIISCSSLFYQKATCRIGKVTSAKPTVRKLRKSYCMGVKLPDW